MSGLHGAKDDCHGARRWAATPDGRGCGPTPAGSADSSVPSATAHRAAATAARKEAEAHYCAYLLDTAHYDGRWRGLAYRCELCGQWTDRFAQLESFVVHRLCPAHLTGEGRSRLLAGPLPSL
jgi:hypothetical protein